MASARLSKNQWSNYWRKATITTFSRRFNENYDQEFRAFWDARFAELPGPARVVDLGTGNGAVALLAAEFAGVHAKRFEVIGLDYADIRPDDDLAALDRLQPLLAQIDFRGGVPIEATGLASGSVDLLTGQYGFEYADTAAAVAEAHRILRPRGRIALVMHHTGSFVVSLARDGSDQVRLCLAEERLDERATALIRVMGEAVSDAQRRQLKLDPEAERLRHELNESVARLNQQAERFQDPEGFLGVAIPNLLNVFQSHKTLRWRTNSLIFAVCVPNSMRSSNVWTIWNRRRCRRSSLTICVLRSHKKDWKSSNPASCATVATHS